MANRRYLVTFCVGTQYAGKFVESKGNDGDQVLMHAVKKFGFDNVSSVYVDNDYNRRYLRMRGDSLFEEV